jgi:glycosyltransferase involved in cell wall biosynthesis
LFLGGLPDYPNLPYGPNTKGGESLMRIWKEVEKSFDREDVPILIFGGPGSDKKEVLDWRETLKFKDKVEILGNIKPSQVREYMEIISLVIIPSKEEGVPNIGFESLAMGLPILGSNVGGIPELVINDINGWILEPNDESGWIEKINDIIQNADILSEMGAKSRQIAEKEFSHYLFGKRILKLYVEVL